VLQVGIEFDAACLPNSSVQLGVHVFELGLEILGQLGSFGLEGGGEKAIVHRERIRMEVYVFHLLKKNNI